MGALLYRRIHPKAVAAILWCVCSAVAEEQSAAPSSEKHHLPAKIVEAVSAKLPKYQPKPAAESEGPHPSAGESEERDGVLYLPNLKVTTAKPMPISEFAWLSPKGRLDLAMKKNPGLRLLPFSKLNNGVALAIQREEREAEARDRLKEEVLSVATGNDAQSRDLVKKMRDAIARPNTDWMGR